MKIESIEDRSRRRHASYVKAVCEIWNALKAGDGTPADDAIICTLALAAATVLHALAAGDRRLAAQMLEDLLVPNAVLALERAALDGGMGAIRKSRAISPARPLRVNWTGIRNACAASAAREILALADDGEGESVVLGVTEFVVATVLYGITGLDRHLAEQILEEDFAENAAAMLDQIAQNAGSGLRQ